MLSGGREMQGKECGSLLLEVCFSLQLRNAAGLLFFPSNGLGEYAIHH